MTRRQPGPLGGCNGEKLEPARTAIAMMAAGQSGRSVGWSGRAHLLAELGHGARRAAHVLPSAKLLVELVGKVLHEDWGEGGGWGWSGVGWGVMPAHASEGPRRGYRCCQAAGGACSLHGWKKLPC